MKFPLLPAVAHGTVGYSTCGKQQKLAHDKARNAGDPVGARRPFRFGSKKDQKAYKGKYSRAQARAKVRVAVRGVGFKYIEQIRRRQQRGQRWDQKF